MVTAAAEAVSGKMTNHISLHETAAAAVASELDGTSLSLTPLRRLPAVPDIDDVVVAAAAAVAVAVADLDGVAGCCDVASAVHAVAVYPHLNVQLRPPLQPNIYSPPPRPNGTWTLPSLSPTPRRPSNDWRT